MPGPKVITVTVPNDPIGVINVQVPGVQGPVGPTGAPGATNVITIGTVSTLTVGSSATATLSGVSPNQVLNLGIPRGATGATGPANTLTIGTVNTLTEGQAATSTITGTAPNQVLNLGIPRGYGLRSGGATGDLLIKLSTTDYDTGWATPTEYQTPGTIVRRAPVNGADPGGWVLFPAVGVDDAPTQAFHVTRKDYVDGKFGSSVDQSFRDLSVRSITTNATVRSAFLKTTSSTEHAATIYQAATSGVDVASALNVVSDNPDSSAMYLSGTEKQRGTLKIAHRGYADASDANAAAISVDLQTIGSATRGFYVFSSTGGTIGDAIAVRLNGREDFVLKSTGRIGIGIPTGATPAGKVEINQNDDTTPGISIKANSTSAANLLEFKRSSDGAVRTRVDAQAQLVSQQTAFFTGPGIMFGSSSSQLGGGSGGVLGIANAGTVPTTNPTGGGVLFSEAGALKWLGPTGGTLVLSAPSSSMISDSTAVGRSVLTAADAAAARTAIGAGTSSLALGTTSTTAKAGDYQPTSANISDAASAATASVVVKRDASGRAKMVDPSASDDIATKNYADTQDAAYNREQRSALPAAGAAYTLALTDEGKMLYTQDATASTVTIPPNATVAFPVGAWIDFQASGSPITVSPGAGVTIANMDAVASTQTRGQNSIIRLLKTGTNTWTASGDAVNLISQLGAAATSASTANTLMKRDANGRASVADPSATTDIATKNYVDTLSQNATAPLIRLRRVANQAVAASTFTSIIWDTEDIASPWVSGANIPIPRDGWYLVSAIASWATAAGRALIKIQKNSGASDLNVGRTQSMSSTSEVGVDCTGLVFLLATDTVNVQVYQDSAGSVNLVGGSAYAPTEINLIWLRPF